MDRDQIIETLLLWNCWEKGVDAGIPRESYLGHIRKFLATDEVVVLTGIRRSGKSTILLQVLAELCKGSVPPKNTLYINFEDARFYSSLSIELIDAIWAAYREYLKPEGRVYLVLDEVQKITGWEHWVRSMYDRKENVKIFVTGSNADILSPELATVLTGRHFQLTVSPLSFNEFLDFNGMIGARDRMWRVGNKEILAGLAAEYLKIGGFPKVVLLKDEFLRKELLAQYFDDILTKDVVARHKVKDAAKLKNLALLYASNFTRGYTFHGVKKTADFAMSLDSVHRFSRYLEDAYMVYFLPRFSYSLKNQMQVERKVYLADNGMHNAVAFKFSEDKGKLLENAVYHHLRNLGREIYYFSEKNEVDFVCKDGLKVRELFNVCYSLKNKETLLREVGGLLEAMRYFKLKSSSIIVAEGQKRHIREDGMTISIVPFYEWALCVR